jgi:UDP-glucose:(heptosyl)LPS alpha-1,3-glucosyltransferase
MTGISFLRDLSFALASCRMLSRQREEFDIIQSHDKTLFQDIYRAGDGCHCEWLRQRWKRTGIAGKLSMLLNPYHWLILMLERMILRGHRFQKIIAISEMVKGNIMDHYGVPSEDIEVIYNGVDLEKFAPENRAAYRSEIRSAHGLLESDFVVLFAGSGFERKGMRYLLEAVESLAAPVTVLVVGKGSDKTLKDRTGRQKVIFCGPREDIHKYYAAADLFVFPTLYEPFGNVHLEALASGLPVITTRNSGASEIIEEGVQGFVVQEPEDVAAIAEKIELLLSDRDRTAALGRNARRLAEEFTFDKHTGRIRHLYERVLREREKAEGPGR